MPNAWHTRPGGESNVDFAREMERPITAPPKSLASRPFGDDASLLFGGSIGLAKQQEEHRLFGDAGDRLYMKKNDDSAFLFGRNSEQATTNSNSNSNSNSNTSSGPLTEFADGRSMLRPSGKRLQVSLSNPGDGMVLRDGDRLIVVPNNEVPEMFDMELDPGQLKPIPIDQSGVTDKRIKGHIEWGKKAAAFVDVLKKDILRAYKTGKRCTHKTCALELLASLESLDQWEGPASKTMDQNIFSSRWFPFLPSS